ncbi:MAG: integrin alpha [Nocardioidaceae bacterium]
MRAVVRGAGAVLAAGLLAVPLAVVPIEGASPAAALPTCAGRPVTSAVDGNGVGDLVVGVPRPGGDVRSAGAVDVAYDTGERQRVTPESLGRTPVPGARFGAAVAAGPVDADRCADLAVGAPGEGAVYLLKGSATGISGSGVVRIGSPGAAGDGFGSQVTMTLRRSDGLTDLWVGAPLTTVSGRREAGMIYHYRLTVGFRPTLVSRVTFAQIGGGVAAGDRLGSVLAPWEIGTVAGVPRRDVSGKADAGAVVVLRQADGPLARQVLTQASPGVAGVPEPGDSFGWAVSRAAQLIVGVPGEDVGPVQDAGMAHLFGSRSGLTFTHTRTVRPGRARILGRPTPGDRFGAAVVAGFGTCGLEGETYLVGAPRQDVGAARDAGTVTRFSRFPGIRCPVVLLRQGVNLPGTAESGDRLGTSVSLARADQNLEEAAIDGVYVGVPGEDGAGIVQRLNADQHGPVSDPVGSAFGTVLSRDAAGSYGG